MTQAIIQSWEGSGNPYCPDLTDIIPSNSNDSDAEKFVSFFKTNYAAVRKEVQEWFVDKYHYSDNAIRNAGTAHQVSCLELCQLPFPDLGSLAAINTDAFENWMINNNWTKITDINQLKPGDICCSGSSPTTFDHFYCFVDYIDSKTADILDNQAFGLHSRSLVGDNYHSPWRFALRMP